MDPTALHQFVAIADAGSLSRAAAALSVSQPTLSRRLRALERECGQRLLERTGRGVVPNDAGRALLAPAKAMLELAERARLDMQERLARPRGRLVVGLPPRVARVLAAELVERFHGQFPEASIAVVEGLSIRLREALVGGRVDVAIAFDPPASPQLRTETLVREPLALMSTSPLPTRVTLAGALARRLVVPPPTHAIRELIDAAARPRGLSPRPVAEVESVQTILSLVARGVGDTVLPASAARDWPQRGPLHVAPVVSPAMRNRLVLAVPTARPATRLTRWATQLLRELATRQFGGRPGQGG